MQYGCCYNAHIFHIGAFLSHGSTAAHIVIKATKMYFCHFWSNEDVCINVTLLKMYESLYSYKLTSLITAVRRWAHRTHVASVAIVIKTYQASVSIIIRRVHRRLTETDVVGEIIQKLCALLSLTAARWACAPRRHVGCGVFSVIWSDGTACTQETFL